MHSKDLQHIYQDLTTPHVSDPCTRLGIPLRCAPPEMRPIWNGTHLVGRIRPARHYGSIDIFLEAITCSSPGDVLVIDNNGRRDEACIGDLITLEARIAALSGVVVGVCTAIPVNFDLFACRFSVLVHSLLVPKERIRLVLSPYFLLRAAITFAAPMISFWVTMMVCFLFLSKVLVK